MSDSSEVRGEGRIEKVARIVRNAAAVGSIAFFGLATETTEYAGELLVGGGVSLGIIGIAEVVRRVKRQPTLPNSPEVNQIVDARIRQRGLDEFKATIDKMAEDPDYRPEPVGFVEAGGTSESGSI